MDKQKLTLLIIGSSISILSLIALQLYWINISYDSQQEQFDQNVMSAMQEVIKKIEKEEAITKVTSQLLLDDAYQISDKDSSTIVGEFPLQASLDSDSDEDELSGGFTQLESDRFKLNIEIPTPRRNDSSTFIMRETKKRVISSTYGPAS